MCKSTIFSTLIVLTSGLAAQSNAVTGLDGRLTSISSFSRLGTTSTLVGYAAQNDMCNVGSVNIPWQAAMAENHPKFGFMLARELNGRFEQISDRSFCKHAFLTINGSGVCGPCQGGSGSLMGLNCTDVYGVFNNGDRFWLGPADEIDPWLGTWNHVGSYFDQGFPNVGAPGNMNGVRSPINPTNSVMNRVTIKKSDIVAGAEYYYQIHLIHEGEPIGNRGDNLMSRGTNINPSSWSASDDTGTALGSIVNRWTGATVGHGSNGTDNGSFYVAGKAVETTPGNWRYEYAVHNADNNRGASSFRVPMCPNANASNFFFRDIDDNSLNQWTGTQVGNEVVFSAPANNPLDWNIIFNFGFDADASPGQGDVSVDQARVGSGALTVSVTNTLTPNGAPTQVAAANNIGPGCGSPSTGLTALGLPTSPNPSFNLLVTTAPNSLFLVAASFTQSSTPLAPGCTQYLDPNQSLPLTFQTANIAGFTVVPLAIPAGVSPFSLYLQAAQIIPGGPVFGAFGLSNGLELLNTLSGGCP